MTCWYHRLPFACFSCPSVFLQRLPYLHDPEFTSDILECLGHFAVSISMQLRKRCDAGAMGAITLLKLWPNSVKSWIMWPRTAKQLFAFQCNSILTSFLDDYLMVHLMINTIERPIYQSLIAFGNGIWLLFYDLTEFHVQESVSQTGLQVPWHDSTEAQFGVLNQSGGMLTLFGWMWCGAFRHPCESFGLK